MVQNAVAAIPMPSATSQATSLHTLPGEIRNIIYEYAIDNDEEEYFELNYEMDDDFKDGRHLRLASPKPYRNRLNYLGLMGTSRLLRAELLPLFLKPRIFCISMVELSQFIDTFYDSRQMFPTKGVKKIEVELCCWEWGSDLDGNFNILPLLRAKALHRDTHWNFYKPAMNAKDYRTSWKSVHLNQLINATVNHCPKEIFEDILKGAFLSVDFRRYNPRSDIQNIRFVLSNTSGRLRGAQKENLLRFWQAIHPEMPRKALEMLQITVEVRKGRKWIMEEYNLSPGGLELTWKSRKKNTRGRKTMKHVGKKHGPPLRP